MNRFMVALGAGLCLSMLITEAKAIPSQVPDIDFTAEQSMVSTTCDSTVLGNVHRTDSQSDTLFSPIKTSADSQIANSDGSATGAAGDVTTIQLLDGLRASGSVTADASQFLGSADTNTSTAIYSLSADLALRAPTNLDLSFVTSFGQSTGHSTDFTLKLIQVDPSEQTAVTLTDLNVNDTSNPFYDKQISTSFLTANFDYALDLTVSATASANANSGVNFRIDVLNPSVVPLPAAVWSGFPCLALLASGRFWKRACRGSNLN